MTDSLSLVSDLIRLALGAGADAADAVLVNGTSLSVASRQGKIEHLERSEGRDLGLRVFVGKRAAIVASTSHDPGGFPALVERAGLPGWRRAGRRRRRSIWIWPIRRNRRRMSWLRGRPRRRRRRFRLLG
jgi:PmbA/TldA metallopeptidase domain 1